MLKFFEKLKSGLDLSISKSTSKERSSSIAITSGGREYMGAIIGSDTHLMNISSEQVALALSTTSNDFPVTEMVTMWESDKKFSLSPIVVKVMVDYAIRTSSPLKYIVINPSDETLFQTDNIQSVFPHYNPEPINIARVKESYSPNMAAAEFDPAKLKEFSAMGLSRNFPLYDSASSYGTAVYTKSGKFYFSGQYSSPDKRLNLHSEMTSILSAIMNGDQEIEAIGIVSSKYPDSPCNMCGSCRQFISEISNKLGISPLLYTFSLNTDEFKKFTISEYLPDSWSSKKW